MKIHKISLIIVILITNVTFNWMERERSHLYNEKRAVKPSKILKMKV